MVWAAIPEAAMAVEVGGQVPKFQCDLSNFGDVGGEVPRRGIRGTQSMPEARSSESSFRMGSSSARSSEGC